MFEYLLVLFPHPRKVLINDEVIGDTNVIIELQGGEYEVTLDGSNFTPEKQVIDLRNTNITNPKTIRFEEV